MICYLSRGAFWEKFAGTISLKFIQAPVSLLSCTRAVILTIRENICTYISVGTILLPVVTDQTTLFLRSELLRTGQVPPSRRFEIPARSSFVFEFRPTFLVCRLDFLGKSGEFPSITQDETHCLSLSLSTSEPPVLF